MKIDKKRLKTGIWFEDKDGNYIDIPPEYRYCVDYIPENADSWHVSWSLEVREEIWFLNDAPMPKNEARKGKPHCTFNAHLGGDGRELVAMVNSGDYTLKEAIAVMSRACERCMNVLLWKYSNGEDGYPEYGEEWQKCNTSCEFCRDEDEKLKKIKKQKEEGKVIDTAYNEYILKGKSNEIR